MRITYAFRADRDAAEAFVYVGLCARVARGGPHAGFLNGHRTTRKGAVMKVGIACGGTGGHIFPGLAVARCLDAMGHDVTLWIGGRDVEDLALEAWSGGVVRIEARGLTGVSSAARCRALWKLVRACSYARGVMRRSRPDVLLAMGSYASVPPAVAAWSLKVPLVVHEANVVPGKAAVLLSRLAASNAVAFREAAGGLRGRVVVTGLPSDRSLQGAFDPGELCESAFKVLVMGGSQGAHVLNEVAAGALCRVHTTSSPVQALHLAGLKEHEAVKRVYADSGVPHLVFGFLQDMGKAYHAADLAICRAGAATCVELSLCGVPAVLVPLPTSAGGHQKANAEAMARAGAAVVLEQAELSADRLVAVISELRSDPTRLESMRRAAVALQVPDATRNVAELVVGAAEADSPAEAASGRASRRGRKRQKSC